ncbi:MAG: 30S ribosome-binding factor RbfA [Nitrospinae bacterium]|nr:30S ribosome-binding factor RbfA [Nitrospinota bacterium]
MGNSRLLRVAELIQSELANMVMRDVKDPRVQHVVITRVEVSTDLRVAKVYFSRYGENQGNVEEIEEGLKGLERASGFLQMKLAERLKLKSTPKLKFYVDHSLAYSAEIERLLSNVCKEVSSKKG